jgi:delta14-sterol reductase
MFLATMSSKTPAKAAELNPRTTSYEFFGPLGALLVTLTVPPVIYALYFGCSEAAGGCPQDLPTIPGQVAAALTNPLWWKGLWDTEASLIYLAWYVFCIVAWAILPGDLVEGTTLRTGEKKKYKINGAGRVKVRIITSN